jgi:hypothetical protein
LDRRREMRRRSDARRTGHITYAFHPSGHMVYAHIPSLQPLHDNVAAFIDAMDNRGNK